jgi:hypothetical protein
LNGQTPYGGFGSALNFLFVNSGNASFSEYDTGAQTASYGPHTYTNNQPFTFDPFYVSTFDVPVTGYVSFVSTDGSASYRGDATSTFTFQETVTYDYTRSVASVPEPSTWAMLLLGFAGIGFMAYRRKAKPAKSR